MSMTKQIPPYLLAVAIYPHDESGVQIIFNHKGVPWYGKLMINTIEKFVREVVETAHKQVVGEKNMGYRYQNCKVGDTAGVVHMYRLKSFTSYAITNSTYPVGVGRILVRKICEEYCEDSSNPLGVLGKNMADFEDSKGKDKVAEVREEIDDVKEIVTKNIDKVIKRGENIDSLVVKCEDLVVDAGRFEKKAKGKCCVFM